MSDSNAAVARSLGLSVHSSGDHVARTADCELVDPTAAPADLWETLLDEPAVQKRLHHALVALSLDCARDDASVDLQDPSRRGWRAADLDALPGAAALNDLDKTDIQATTPGAGVRNTGGNWTTMGLAAVEADHSELWRSFVETTRRLHGSNASSIDGDLDATAAALDLFAHVAEHGLTFDEDRRAAPPQVLVRLGGEWASQPPERRARQLRWLVRWSAGLDLRLVATGMVARRLVREHDADLPAAAVSEIRNHLTTAALADAAGDEPTAAVAERALGELEDDDTAWRVLQVLAEPPAQQRTHAELKTDQRLSWPRSDGEDWPRVRQACKRLADAGVVETERDGNTWRKLLTPAGHVALQRREQETEQRADAQPAPDTATADTGTSDPADGPTAHTGGSGSPSEPAAPAVSDPPKPPACSVFAPGREDGEGEGASSGAAAGPPARHWLGTAQHDAISAATTGADVAVLDAAVPPQADSRDVFVGFEADREEIVVSVEFHDFIAVTLTRLATAFTDPQLLREALPPRVLEDDDGDLDLGIPGGNVALRRGPGIGWLSDDVQDGAALLQSLDEARRELLTLSGFLGRDEDGDVASDVCQLAHGLIGTVTHLCNQVGITPLRHLRAPDHIKNGDDLRVHHLCKMLATGAYVSSTYGAGDVYNGYAVMVETDAETRDDAMTTPAIEPDETAGRHLGSWLVSGQGLVDGPHSLLEPLQAADSLRDLADPAVDDNRTFAVDLQIREAWSRRTATRAAQLALDRKNLIATPDAVGVYHALCEDPFAVTWGINRGLGAEEPDRRRHVHLDEVRRSLATVPSRRLLPSLHREGKTGDLLSVLLGASAPLATAEAADRAGMTTDTAAQQRDRLAALGLVDVDDRGEGRATWIRVRLPRREERDDDTPPRPEHLAAVEVGRTESLTAALADRPPPTDWTLLEQLELATMSIGAGIIDEDPERWDDLRRRGVDLDDVVSGSRRWTRPWLDVLAALQHRDRGGAAGRWTDGPASGVCELGAEPEFPDRQAMLDRWLQETGQGPAAAD